MTKRTPFREPQEFHIKDDDREVPTTIEKTSPTQTTPRSPCPQGRVQIVGQHWESSEADWLDGEQPELPLPKDSGRPEESSEADWISLAFWGRDEAPASQREVVLSLT